MHPPKNIVWLAQSSRCFRGQPDARYGVLTLGDGRPAFVKHLPDTANPQGATLVSQERRALRVIASKGLAAPRLIEDPLSDAVTLVTEFRGVSLASLLNEPSRLTTAEASRAFVALMHIARAYASADVLPLDVSAANVVYALEGDLNGGRVLLDRACLVDHAMTMSRDIERRSPAWMSPDMPRVAPELRAGLEQDHEEMRDAFAKLGVQIKPLESLNDSEFAALRRAYGSYDAKQVLQGSIVANYINVDAALQYAIGRALEGFARERQLGSNSQVQHIIATLLADDPAARFANLETAATAWEGAVPTARLPHSAMRVRALMGEIHGVESKDTAADGFDGTYLPADFVRDQSSARHGGKHPQPEQAESLHVDDAEPAGHGMRDSREWRVPSIDVSTFLTHAANLGWRAGAVAATAWLLLKTGLWGNTLAPALYGAVRSVTG